MRTDNKLMFGIIIGLAFFLFAISFSSAVTIVNPSTGGTISGTYYFNVTNSTFPNLVNCSFYMKSPSTANSTWSFIGTAFNSSANALQVNMSVSLALKIEDASDYTLNATCRNSTSVLQDDTESPVIVDYTVPQAPTSLNPTTTTLKNNKSSQIFSATVVNVNTTSCTFSKGINGGNFVSVSATYSGTSCTYVDTSFTSSALNGEYYWYFTASDGKDVASSSNNVLSVQIPGDGGGVYIPSSITPEQKKNIAAIFIILILAVIVYFIVKK